MRTSGKPKWESAALNNKTYLQYYYRLMELSLNMYEWKNLPDTCDERFLELCLISEGMAIFFEEPDIGFLTLQTMIGGNLDVYRIPKIRTAYAVNGFQRQLDDTNSVIIFNNYMHTNSLLDIEQYARRLYEIERAIDVNVKGQKTPLIISCSENQRLSMKNLLMKYDGNEPFIYGDKLSDLPDSIKVLRTDVPFISDKLQILKRQVWNEALTYIGIENSNTEKKERLVTSEVDSNLGGVEAQRFTRLNARRQAAGKINKMWGLNIQVDFRREEQVFEEPESFEEGGDGLG